MKMVARPPVSAIQFNILHTFIPDLSLVILNKKRPLLVIFLKLLGLEIPPEAWVPG